MVSAWRNFKDIFSRPLFTIIFSPEMLKFHPYSILTGETMVTKDKNFLSLIEIKHFLLYRILCRFDPSCFSWPEIFSSKNEEKILSRWCTFFFAWPLNFFLVQRSLKTIHALLLMLTATLWCDDFCWENK